MPLVSRSHIVAAVYLDIDADQIMSEMHPFRKLRDCLRFVTCSHGTDQMLHQAPMTIGSDPTMQERSGTAEA